MNHILLTHGIIDPEHLEGLSEYIWVLDTSLNDAHDLIEVEIHKEHIRRCSLFIAFGPEASHFEEVVDNYIIELNSSIFFPTISEINDINQLISIISGWNQDRDRNIVLQTSNKILINSVRKAFLIG